MLNFHHNQILNQIQIRHYIVSITYKYFSLTNKF